jgi:hypothetical protein
VAHRFRRRRHVLRDEVTNTTAPLKIIALGNSWENAHPDVAYVPQGFAGYPYWMIFTPYPSLNDRSENPTIRASYDGLCWERVPGTSDPLVPAPNISELHHADPEIVYSSGRLYLMYATIRNESNEVTFSAMSCLSDLRWSEPQVIHKDVGAVSPTFSFEENVWRVWFMRMKYPAPLSTFKANRDCSLVRREGSNLASLQNERSCHLEIPHHVPWHIDIQRVKEGYEALVVAFPDGTDESRTRLFHLSSEDGLTFNLSSKNPIIAPSFLGWDNRSIYRSCFLKDADGNYRIWYSGRSWGNHFGIGFVQGPLDNLRGPPGPFVSVPSYVARFPGEVKGRLKHEASLHLPSWLLSIVARRDRVK